MSRAIRALAAATLLAAVPALAQAQAQAGCTPEHAAMGHCALPASEPAPASAPTPAPAPGCTLEHAAMGHCTVAPASAPAATQAGDPACPPAHAAMGHCVPRDSGAQAPREPIPLPTDADRTAAFAPLRHAHGHEGGINSLVRFDRFEAWAGEHGNGQAWEGRAWIGGDVQRLWLRSEGERADGRIRAADLEALYGRGIGPWWDLLLGVRHDFDPGPSRSWAAIGVQGTAPYKFEVAATAYLGDGGRSAFKAEAEYALFFTGRLVLQPRADVTLYGRDDPRRGLGAGLSTAGAGLRLRYEVTRRFAPYVGIAYERAYGGSADYRRQAGEAPGDMRWVAGVRGWF